MEHVQVLAAGTCGRIRLKPRLADPCAIGTTCCNRELGVMTGYLASTSHCRSLVPFTSSFYSSIFHDLGDLSNMPLLLRSRLQCRRKNGENLGNRFGVRKSILRICVLLWFVFRSGLNNGSALPTCAALPRGCKHPSRTSPANSALASGRSKERVKMQGSLADLFFFFSSRRCFRRCVQLHKKDAVVSCVSPHSPSHLDRNTKHDNENENQQDMEVQQRKKYPNWAEEQRKKAAELARVRAIREKKMDRNKKEVGPGCCLAVWL